MSSIWQHTPGGGTVSTARPAPHRLLPAPPPPAAPAPAPAPPARPRVAPARAPPHCRPGSAGAGAAAGLPPLPPLLLLRPALTAQPPAGVLPAPPLAAHRAGSGPGGWGWGRVGHWGWGVSVYGGVCVRGEGEGCGRQVAPHNAGWAAHLGWKNGAWGLERGWGEGWGGGAGLRWGIPPKRGWPGSTQCSVRAHTYQQRTYGSRRCARTHRPACAGWHHSGFAGVSAPNRKSSNAAKANQQHPETPPPPFPPPPTHLQRQPHAPRRRPALGCRLWVRLQRRQRVPGRPQLQRHHRTQRRHHLAVRHLHIHHCIVVSQMDLKQGRGVRWWFSGASVQAFVNAHACRQMAEAWQRRQRPSLPSAFQYEYTTKTLLALGGPVPYT